jgi:tetratricopeptide (TPR) repeat protein
MCTLVPVIGIIQVGRQAMADRYSYIPSIGLFVAVVWFVSDWVVRRPTAKAWVGVVEVGVIASCAVLTHVQASYWKDTASLFEHAIAVTGENAVAENNLGASLFKAGNLAKAEPHFAEAVRIKRNYPEALVNLGLCRERTGLTNEAIGFYERAVQFQPTALAYYNLANVLSKQGELERAEINYRSALELKPEFADALYNYGALLAKRGRIDDAAGKYAAALKLKPDFADVHLSFGALLAGQQKWTEAIAEFNAALRSDPSNANTHFNLGAIYQAKGDFSEAAKHFGEACRLRPDDVESRERLGLLLLSLGKPNEAVTCFQEAARLRPQANLHYELALAFDATRQGEKALPEYREAIRLSPTSAVYMNDLAWMLATSADLKVRDISEAIRLAEQACRVSGGNEARFFGTLDAAYSGAGRFEEAIATAQKARELALASGQKQIAQQAEERLALYRARKPYYSAVMPSANP